MRTNKNLFSCIEIETFNAILDMYYCKKLKLIFNRFKDDKTQFIV